MSAELKGLLDALAAIGRYDLANGTDLAQTLDALLASGGSVARTSSELFIHRNTLRQRIQRIEELIGRSPEHFEDLVIAGIAARLIRDGGSDGAPDPSAHRKRGRKQPQYPAAGC